MTTLIIVASDPEIGTLVRLAADASTPGVHDTVALVVGPHDWATRVAASGVDQVIWAEADFPEACAPTVASIAEALRPTLVLAGHADADRALAGAVAARLGAAVLTAATAITPETVTHAVGGGVALATVRRTGPVVVLSDLGPSDTPPTSQDAPIRPIVADPWTIDVALTQPDPTRVDLASARRIVAVGRGLSSRSDLDRIHRLADRIGAEVACSRPLAEGLGWLPRSRYVGATGASVAPELYVALGISGQQQHLVGMRDAGTVVVVNTDASAPFFGESDLGYVGDLGEFVDALIDALG